MLKLNLAFCSLQTRVATLSHLLSSGRTKGLAGSGDTEARAVRTGLEAASRLEGTEVMCPQEVLGSFLHGSHIQAAAGSQMSGQEEWLARQAWQAPAHSNHSLKPLTLLEAPSTGSLFKYRHPVRPRAAGS